MTLGEAFASILQAARTGSDSAWRAIFDDLSGPVYGYLRSRGAAEPEDLAAEVFLQVARDLARFTGGEPEFRSWVFVVAHHRLLDERRYRRRHPAEAAPAEALAARAGEGDVEEEAMRSLGTQDVVRLLESIPVAQREVLLLRMVAGLSIEEVARTTRRTPNAVKALQRRGLAAIRKKLTREATPSPGPRR
ncbi:MAG TPA: RNA polymerase sigma factor [Actinomycetota bacterium]|nr:RNA polymerase sigma factor [Actinomycetota bacterium]